MIGYFLNQSKIVTCSHAFSRPLAPTTSFLLRGVLASSFDWFIGLFETVVNDQNGFSFTSTLYWKPLLRALLLRFVLMLVHTFHRFSRRIESNKAQVLIQTHVRKKLYRLIYEFETVNSSLSSCTISDSTILTDSFLIFKVTFFQMEKILLEHHGKW